MANLIIRPNSGTGTNWTSITNVYDTNTTTGAQVTGLTSSNYSQSALTLTFPAMNIPSNAVISKATLTVIAKQDSSTSYRRITVQADINGNSSNRVIDTQLTTTSNTTLTADITDYIFDTDLSSLKITPYTTNIYTSYPGTLSIYDVNIDVEYVLYDKKVVEFKCSLVDSLMPSFNSGFRYTTIDTTLENGLISRTIYTDSLPTMCKFDSFPSNLLEVLYLDTSNMTTMAYMFKDCVNLVAVNTTGWDTSKVTDMSYMFYKCESLTMIDVSNWDVEHVTSMAWMFANCIRLVSLDLSKWNTTNMLYMNCMFQNCDYLQTIGDVSNWNVSNVTTMQNMFDLCQSLTVLDLSNWNTSKVQNMGAMFGSCYNLTELKTDNWDTSNVINTSWMFNRNFNLKSLDLSSWNTSKITNMTWMFTDCTGLETLNLNGWNIKNAEYSNMFMPYEYTGCSNLNYISMNNSDYNSVNGIIEQLPQRSTDNYGLLMVTNADDFSQVNVTAANTKNWNVWENKIKIAEYKFNNTLYDLIPEFNEGFTYIYEDIVNGEVTTRTIYNNELPTKIQFGTSSESDKASSLVEVDYLNTSNLTTMYSMFKHCYNATKINASSWDTSKVTNMAYAFNDCQSLLTIDASNWDTGEVTDMEAMFCRCFAENIENSIKNWDVSKVTNMKFMLDTTESIRHFDLSSWDVNSVIYLDGLFGWSYNLYTINLTGWNTSNVTSMTGMFTDCYSLTTIIGIEDLDTSKVEHVTEGEYGIFTNCYSLTELDLSKWDVSNVTDMSNMFRNCQMLSSIGNINNWDTSNVTTMQSMFHDCFSLMTLNLSHWDTSNVTTMQYMFYNAIYLNNLDISNWMINVTAVVTDIFGLCENLNNILMNDSDYNSVNKIISVLPIRAATEPGMLDAIGVDDASLVDKTTAESKNWNVKLYKIAEYKFNSSIDTLFSEVNDGFVYTHTDIDNGDGTITRTLYSDQLPTMVRFEDCEGLLEVNYLDTSELTSLRKTFKNCYNVTLINATDWDTSKVTSLYEAFEDCNNLTTLDVSNWDTSNVTNMDGMFNKCNNLTQLDVSNFDTSNVTNMAEMFYNCKNLTALNVSDWNTSNVTDMKSMFSECQSLAQLDVSNFNISNVTNMSYMFNECSQLTQLDVSNWDTKNVKNMGYMFNKCNNLTTLDVSNFDTSNVTDMGYMFNTCNNLTTLDVSNFDTSNVTDMSYMFHTCNNLTTLDVSNWDTSNVIKIDRLFSECESLTSLDVSNFDTSNVIDMQYMFEDCHNITSLNLSNFDTSNVTNMTEMINECCNLTELNISNWHLNSEVDVTDIFTDTNVLTNVIMNNSDSDSVNKIIAALPTRASDSMGTLDITDVDDYSQVNVTTAESKYWNIIGLPQIKVVEYKFTNSSDLVPVFNEGFIYTYEDMVDGTTTIRAIYSTELPTAINFTGQTTLMEVYYLDTSNLTSTYDLFYNCTNLTYVDFRNSDFSKVETIERMFAFCSNLIKIDGLNDINVSNVNNMGGLFTDCPKIPEIDVKDWDVSKVTNFGAVFRRCTALSKIDVAKWNTSSGVIMSGIFTNCTSLTEIDIYNWDTTNANSVSQMFYGCSKLELIKSFNHIGPNTVTTYLFGKCTSLKHVQLPDSDVYTINKVIEELPTRNATDLGILDVLGADIIDQIDVTTARNKYWNVIAIHNIIKNIHIGDIPINTLFSQGNKKIKSVYFGDNKLY